MTRRSPAKSCPHGLHLAAAPDFFGKGAQVLSFDAATREHTQSNRLTIKPLAATEAWLATIEATTSELGKTTALASEPRSLTSLLCL
jgi:hypothetical protein